jgi:ABC-type uncharacterized transport system permease subunit
MLIFSVVFCMLNNPAAFTLASFLQLFTSSICQEIRCEISGSHSSEYEGGSLLGYSKVSGVHTA